MHLKGACADNPSLPFGLSQSIDHPQIKYWQHYQLSIFLPLTSVQHLNFFQSFLMSASKCDRSDLNYKATPGPETKKPKKLLAMPIPEDDLSSAPTKPMSQADVSPLTYV